MMNLTPARCPLSEGREEESFEDGRDTKKKLKKAVISLTLRVWGANLLFWGMGFISKRDEQKKKRERHRENLSYNDGVASGVLKGVRPASDPISCDTYLSVYECVSFKKSCL